MSHITPPPTGHATNLSISEQERPDAASVAIVDRYVADLDRAESAANGDIYTEGMSRSFGATADLWHGFFLRMKRLDEAMRDPLAPGAAATLCTAISLFMSVKTEFLASAIEHVGTAVLHYHHAASGSGEAQP